MKPIMTFAQLFGVITVHFGFVNSFLFSQETTYSLEGMYGFNKNTASETLSNFKKLLNFKR